ncbi:hypothetical protein ACR784_01455 [Sphingobacterium multivorum]|uniref:hypothetical protein n=1 Tax=Sphingobacterium TaxID=28453 RepID=UPI003DA50D82
MPHILRISWAYFKKFSLNLYDQLYVMKNAPDKIPMRWRYPSLENNYNSANLDEAMQRQYKGNDEINQLMWLLK